MLNCGKQNMFPLALRYFDLKNGISNHLFDFSKDFNESSEDIKQKITDILFRYRVCSSICIFNRQYKCKSGKIAFCL